MMKLIKTFMVLILLISLMSCIEKRTKQSANTDPNMIQSLEGPRVIRDTVIQVVILDTVDNRKQIVIEEPTRTTATTATRSNNTSAYRSENDRVDRSNSGFFDNYRSSYAGDPNKDLQPIVRTVVSNADDVEKQKVAIAREIENLDQQNKIEKEKAARMERERQAANTRAIEDAKAKQAQQQQQQQQPKKPAGKTLNTDLFY